MAGELIEGAFRDAVAAFRQRGVNDAISQANADARSWKEYAQKVDAKWTEYAKQLEARIAWLEDNLKRQSANAVALQKLAQITLDELKLFGDPEKCKMLDPAARKKLIDQHFDDFMRGDRMF